VPFSLENQKVAAFCKVRILKKGWAMVHEIVSLFVGHGFSRERDNKPYPTFHMRKGVLLIYRIMAKMFDFGEQIMTFGCTRIIRCFRA
jgi:hypothetical protein